MDRITVAALQLGGVSCNDFESYAAYVSGLLDTVKSAQLIVLPEYAALPLLATQEGIPRAGMRHAFDETFFGCADSYHQFFASQSRKRRCYILAGTHWTQGSEGPRNVAYVFAPDGTVQSFAKCRPTPAEEAMGMAVGTEPGIVEIDGVRAGILVCFDSEFPELAAQLVRRGADLLLLPSLTFNERGAWRVELCARARALENQAYVLLSTNQTRLQIPHERPIRGTGRSAIFGPIDNRTRLVDGVVARAAAGGDQVVLADLDLGVLELCRQASEAPLRRHWTEG